MDTASIIDQCASGDREAMARLYRAYSPRMLRLILRYVSDPAAAEDILHDGFIIILSHISEVRVPAKLEYWMGTIMKNLAIQYLSRLEVAELLDGDDEPADSPDMDDILTYDELEIIINRLPEGYRTIFKLAVLENKSHKEIGEMLGIAPHSSSSQLARAKAMLRRMIDERRAALGIGLLLIAAATTSLFMGRRMSMAVPVAVAVGESTGAETEDGTGDVKAIISDSTVYYAQNNTVVAKSALTRSQEVGESAESAGEPDVATAGGNVESDVVSLPAQADGITADDDGDVLSPDSSSTTVTTDGGTPERNVSASVSAPASGEADESAAVKKTRLFRRWGMGMSYDVRSGSNSHGDKDFIMSSPGGNENPPEPSGPEGEDGTSRSVASRASDGHTVETRRSMPVTIGLSLNRRLNQRLGIETGLNFTYLRTEVSEKNGNQTYSESAVRTYYVGVPLKINFRIATYYPVAFYGSCGVGFDFPVAHSVRASYGEPVHPDKRIQFSVSGGLGLEYRLSPSMSIYAEPSVRYYPDNGSSCPVYPAGHPWEVSVPVGLRFNW